ncbi:hypothetical protein BJY14_004239 [Actinomadura luteofluorescens]|uniref:Uncharacterized protein n=1 Tax=Actinomadura luteofluorescens TaxID=46163 RepID=A0A7Y9EIP6_9ACTN|nr:hypothetical protein [Actinomadura luteofluorescens]
MTASARCGPYPAIDLALAKEPELSRRTKEPHLAPLRHVGCFIPLLLSSTCSGPRLTTFAT